jgi:hypothetical protein
MGNLPYVLCENPGNSCTNVANSCTVVLYKGSQLLHVSNAMDEDVVAQVSAVAGVRRRFQRDGKLRIIT